MTEETTTEQLAEIDRDMADIERQVAELVEEAQQADYPQPQPQPVQVREGRWRTRGGDIRNVTPTPSHDSRAKRWPWRDAKYDQTWTPNGRCQFDCEESPSDLVEYLGPIEPDKTQELETKTQELEGKTQELPEYTPPEGWRVVRFGELLLPGDVWVNHEGESRPTKRVGERVNDERYIRPIDPQPQPEPEPDTELQAQVAFLKGREVTLGTRLQQEKEVTTRLRGDLELVQKLLGTEKRRVAELEKLVTSLRTINEAQERAFNAANKANDDLEHRLNVVAAELVTQFETSRRLQIELDAAQQVPQAIADRFEEGWNQGTARAVEAVLAWLEPVRLVDNPNLANEAMQHLPQIMRHLTGLAQD